jgi:hypothetical protein
VFVGRGDVTGGDVTAGAVTVGAVTVGAEIVDAEIVDAEIVDVGMIVSPGKGPFGEAGPAQLLSSARITPKTISDRICFCSAKKYFIEEISWK